MLIFVWELNDQYFMFNFLTHFIQIKKKHMENSQMNKSFFIIKQIAFQIELLNTIKKINLKIVFVLTRRRSFEILRKYVVLQDFNRCRILKLRLDIRINKTLYFTYLNVLHRSKKLILFLLLLMFFFFNQLVFNTVLIILLFCTKEMIF